MEKQEKLQYAAGALELTDCAIIIDCSALSNALERLYVLVQRLLFSDGLAGVAQKLESRQDFIACLFCSLWLLFDAIEQHCVRVIRYSVACAIRPVFTILDSGRWGLSLENI